MKRLIPLILLGAAPAPVNHPRTYLLSIVGMPVTSGESVESFSIKTWGLEFKSVCSIPGGWRIKVGASATPDGVIEGEGSQGATWFNSQNPNELRNFVLVTLYAPVQRQDVRNGPDATFKGYATVSTDTGEPKRLLSYRNIRLVPARRCPP